MGVKTITIDLAAYASLSRYKRPGQSFSQVIKERLGTPKTGADLMAVLSDARLSTQTLDAIERQLRQRRASPARAVKL